MAVETDPKKIAERLEQTKRARQDCRPKNYEDAAGQILRHSMEAGQITEKEFQLKLEEVKRFARKLQAEASDASN